MGGMPGLYTMTFVVCLYSKIYNLNPSPIVLSIGTPRSYLLYSRTSLVWRRFVLPYSLQYLPFAFLLQSKSSLSVLFSSGKGTPSHTTPFSMVLGRLSLQNHQRLLSATRGSSRERCRTELLSIPMLKTNKLSLNRALKSSKCSLAPRFASPPSASYPRSVHFANQRRLADFHSFGVFATPAPIDKGSSCSEES